LQAAETAYKTVKSYLDDGEHDIKVYFIFHNDENKKTFEEAIS
jgi:O-acetyl-ADP-ribose deacetylase (regulator of RNase III)